MSILNDFLLSMEGYYREFDSNSFVQNSKGALSGKFDALNAPLDASIYIKSLNNAINDLENIWVDSRALKDFQATIQSTPRFDDMGQVPSLMDTSIRINVDYLKDYSQNINANMNSLFTAISQPGASYSSSMTSKLNNEGFIYSVKKNVVKSQENIYDMSAKNSMMPDTNASVTCTKDYINTQIIPFANNFNSLKNQTLKEAKELKDVIFDITNDANVRNRASGNYANNNPDYIKDINRSLYQGQRGLMEVIAFTTYAELRKIHAIEANARTCNIVLSKLNGISGDAKNLLTEGVLTDSIAPDNIGELADNLLQRNAVSYTDIANRVFNFHEGLISSMAPPSVEDQDALVDSIIEETEYDNLPYDCIHEITTVVGAALDSLNSTLEDTMLVFDEIVEKAGLTGDLRQRYAGKVSMISDTSRYDSAAAIGAYGNGSIDEYKVLLHELKDYPKNMEEVAGALTDLNEKMKIFDKRLKTNVNGEFKNAALIHELDVFIDALREQYANLVNDIAGQFMLRLKKISLDAERIAATIEERRDEPFEVEEYVSDMDLDLEMDRLTLEYEQGVTDILMSELFDAYQIEMTQKNRHLRLIEEEVVQPGPAQNAQQGNTQANNAQAQPTSQTQNQTQGNVGTTAADAAQKASNLAQNAKGRLQNLQNTINEQFDKLIQNYVSKMQVNNITKFLNQNKEFLTKSDFNANAAIQGFRCYPYEQMPFNTMISNIATMRNTIGQIKPADAGALSNPAALYNRVFGSLGVNVKDGQDASGCGKQAATQLKWYYYCGKTRKPQEKMYTDKNAFVKSAVEEVENYATGGQNQLTKAIQDIRDQVKNMSSQFVAQNTNESVEWMDSYFKAFYEVEDPVATPEEKEDKKEPATVVMDTKAKAAAAGSNGSTYDLMNNLQTASRVYAGAIFNATRDRIRDYMNIMGSLTKQNTGAAPAEGENQQQEGQPTA